MNVSYKQAGVRMSKIELKPGIDWVGVNDRSTRLFEGLWPIEQEGVSYNTYFINDEKKAIIDLASEGSLEDLLTQLRAAAGDLSQLNYLVVNHMEPDHSGALAAVRALAPQAVILTTEKARGMLDAFYGIRDNVQAVKDGETISLGTHTLQFFHTPFVHWPETMMTFEPNEGILFSCDGFGGYGALDGGRIFDDQYDDLTFFEQESLRYYVNIVAAFSRPVKNAIKKLGGLPIKMIAPSHGLVWRKNPGRIVELYQQWASLAGSTAAVEITLLFASMYRNTERMMNAVAHGAVSAGVPVKIFDVRTTPISYILPSLWTRQGVLVGAPTYEGGLFPTMTSVLDMARNKHIYSRKTGYFGSYSWHGGGEAEFRGLAEKLQWQNYEPLCFKCGASTENLQKAEAYGAAFARWLAESPAAEIKVEKEP